MVGGALHDAPFDHGKDERLFQNVAFDVRYAIIHMYFVHLLPSVTKRPSFTVVEAGDPILRGEFTGRSQRSVIGKFLPNPSANLVGESCALVNCTNLFESSKLYPCLVSTMRLGCSDVGRLFALSEEFEERSVYAQGH